MQLLINFKRAPFNELFKDIIYAQVSVVHLDNNKRFLFISMWVSPTSYLNKHYIDLCTLKCIRYTKPLITFFIVIFNMILKQNQLYFSSCRKMHCKQVLIVVLPNNEQCPAWQKNQFSSRINTLNVQVYLSDCIS